MNKKRITVFIIIAVVILTAIGLFVTKHHWYGGIYHTQINVGCSIDGQLVDLKDNELFFGDGVTSYDKKKFHHNEHGNYAKFMKGIDGTNEFEIYLSPEQTGLTYDVIINFGRYNFNEWYRNKYDINISVTTLIDDKADISITQNIQYYENDKLTMKKMSFSNERKKQVSPNDRTVKIGLE